MGLTTCGSSRRRNTPARWSDPGNSSAKARHAMQPRSRAVPRNDLTRFKLVHLDEPRHATLRSLLTRAFTPRAIEVMRGHAERVVKRRLAELGPRGEMDLPARLLTSLHAGDDLRDARVRARGRAVAARVDGRHRCVVRSACHRGDVRPCRCRGDGDERLLPRGRGGAPPRSRRRHLQQPRGRGGALGNG